MTAELVAVRPVDPGDRAGRLVVAFLAGRRSAETRRAYTRDLTAWAEWCTAHGLDVLDVRPAHVTLWLAEQAEQDPPPAESTKARRLAAVSSWYRWLVREGVCDRNPADLDPGERPTVDRHYTPTVSLSAQQAAALLDQADRDRNPRTAPIVAVLLFCGLRVAELCSADVDQVTMDRGHMVIDVMGKGRRRRRLDLPPAAFVRLDTYLRSRDDLDRLPALAAGARPARPLIATSRGRRVSQQEVDRLLRRLCVDAGGELAELAGRMSAHVLRHTFATLLLDAGVPLREVQDALGHADPGTTRRYDHAATLPGAGPSYVLARLIKTTHDQA